jgi:AmiR/NasT family two-component response regulator
MYNHKTVNTDTGEETIVELSKAEVKVIEANIEKTNAELAEAAAKAEAKAALLQRLGITEEEAALLLG